ncbi:MAG: LCP family protein [Desulfitobacteriaceae bacterium]|nr:LCP family protein [Desulfitobacteriaceae bacterium]
MKGGTQFGTKETIKAVSNLCKCDINYYLKINFKGFEEFVDTLGGIELELPQPVKLTYAGITLPATKQQLNGSTSLDLVCERESLKDGDFGRQRNQALVLKSIVRKVVEPQNLERLPTLVKQLKRDVIDC